MSKQDKQREELENQTRALLAVQDAKRIAVKEFNDEITDLKINIESLVKALGDHEQD